MSGIDRYANALPRLYTSQMFRNAIEDHLPILKSHPGTKLVPIEPIDGLNRQGDIYGLFADMKLPEYLWWTTMRLNEYTSTYDYDGSQLIFSIPDESYIQQLASAVAMRMKGIS